VQSNNGNPVFGRNVNFRVVSGPNVGRTGSGLTNASGNALFSYSSLLAGTDTLQACMINSAGANQCSNLVSRTWVGNNTVTHSFVLDPPSAINPLGSTHTITAMILNSFGQPVVGVNVVFTALSGPNAGVLGNAMTNAQGKASLTYGSAGAGTDMVQAFAVLAGVSQTSNVVTKMWTAQTGAPTITLSPLTSVTPIGGQRTLSANAFSNTGTLVPGVTISFNVLAGPRLGLLGTAVTDGTGTAKINYSSNIGGVDTIQALGVVGGIPTGSNNVTNNWTGLLCDVDNNGRVDNRDITLVFQARSTLVPLGDVRDANFDGKIDATDLRACTLRCTSAGCAQ
jgi:hypothetical protein